LGWFFHWARLPAFPLPIYSVPATRARFAQKFAELRLGQNLNPRFSIPKLRSAPLQSPYALISQYVLISGSLIPLPGAAQIPRLIHTALSILDAIRCDQRIPRVLLFLWESSPRAPDQVMTAAEDPCFAASALSPVRVARVSRLIGNSDTTANRRGWQVFRLRRFTQMSFLRTWLAQFETSPQSTNATPIGVAHTVLRWSLASQLNVWPVVFSTVPTAGSPDRYVPLSGPLLGGCSCRVSAFFWLPGVLSGSLFITGILSIAIGAPFLNMFDFNCLCSPHESVFLDSRSNKGFLIPKTVDRVLNPGKSGNNVCPGLPRESA
jgi:hypothetical protein